MSDLPEEALRRVRETCARLPLATEKVSHGAPSFFIEGGGQFAMLMDNHHDDGRLALWLAAPPGVQEALIAENAEVYFRPPYVGQRGWIGVRLDRDLPWEAAEDLVVLAHETIFEKKKTKIRGNS